MLNEPLFEPDLARSKRGKPSSRTRERCESYSPRWRARPGTQVFRDIDENPSDETFPGIAVLRMDGGVFFATAETLERHDG